MSDYPAFMLRDCPLMAGFMARRKDLLARLKHIVENSDSPYAGQAVALLKGLLQGRG